MKSKRLNLNLPVESYQVIKSASMRRKQSMSAFLSELMQDLNLADRDKVRVVLNIPREVAKNSDVLRNWLLARIDPLIEQVGKK